MNVLEPGEIERLFKCMKDSHSLSCKAEKLQLSDQDNVVTINLTYMGMKVATISSGVRFGK